jgi:RNA polymerase sigma-70 factor (ECF subfamily)
VIDVDPLMNPEPLIRRVYAYVAYRIGDGAEAEDVTSATFERALRYRASFDARRGTPAAWLIGIARRCIDDALAARSADVPPSAETRSAEDLEGETLRRLSVRAAVATLTPRERELIALRYGADLKARQIAELLGERTNTVEVALHRALGRLRTLLEGSDAAVRIDPSAAVVGLYGPIEGEEAS